MKNNLQTFTKEMFKITLKTDDGEILFDAESIAISLGLKQVAKSGNVVVRWDRVNKYLSSSYPQVGTLKKGDFIPEAMVYKLAFKANNAVAEKFQDWLAIEVLPSIRKTGTYSIAKPQQLKLPDTTYEYKPKFYKGQPVVTYMDLEHFTKIPKSTFNYHMNRNRAMFVYGTDFWYLEGKELARFKRDNNYSKYINSITVITKSGFDKLATLVCDAPKKLECFGMADGTAEKDFKYGIRGMINAAEALEKSNYDQYTMFLFLGALKVAQSLPRLRPDFIQMVTE